MAISPANILTSPVSERSRSHEHDTMKGDGENFPETMGNTGLLDRFVTPSVSRREGFSAKAKLSLQENSNVSKASVPKRAGFDDENDGRLMSSSLDVLLKYEARLKKGACYSSSLGNGTAINRDISLEPERILDAPGVVDDFYLNCVSWSARNVLGIGLGGSVYLWNGSTGTVDELCNLNHEDGGEKDYVSSLAWIHDGSYLAIGSSDSSVQLWDVAKAKRMRIFAGHEGRVSSVAWNKHLLTSGDQHGGILSNDVRSAKPFVSQLHGHKGQICGLQWGYDGRQLASGSNDNSVRVWDSCMISSPSPSSQSKTKSSNPLFTFTHHAAVKALAWCPWQSNTLATGGGIRDRCLKFWSTSTGVCSRSVDTAAQVSAVVWSKTYRELITAHGFSSNSLSIWKYPSLAQIKEIPTAHDSRILHMAISPDGERIATVAADENLKIWKVFEQPKVVGKSSKTRQDSDSPLLMISHMTETSAKLKALSSPYSSRTGSNPSWMHR